MAEQHAPERITPQRLGDYLEMMSKAVSQSGISWRVVESKWSGTREAFLGFDTEAVAGFNEPELDALTNDRRVIRNRRKLEAVVESATRMVELAKQYGSFQSYLRAHGGLDATVKELRKQFKFVGGDGCLLLPLRGGGGGALLLGVASGKRRVAGRSGRFPLRMRGG